MNIGVASGQCDWIGSEKEALPKLDHPESLADVS